MKQKKSQEIPTKTLLIAAAEKSPDMSVAALCRQVGVTRSTFYFHYYKDADFRKSLLITRQKHLANKIAAA